MLKNYFLKTLFAAKISRNTNTFFNLIINSKNYSAKLKSNLLDTNDQSVQKYEFKLLGKKIDFLIRTFKGDLAIFYEIFWGKAYLIPSNLMKSPRIIVDLGGHVGFTSIFYALKYPHAKIFSVEASKENFIVLQHNITSFENITALNNAIYIDDGEVLFDEKGLSYNTKISSDGKPVNSLSVNSLMDTFNIDKIDLLKIDIEGGEEFLLKNNTDWLNKTSNIIIELHTPYDITSLKKDLEQYNFKIISPNHRNRLKNIFATKTVIN